MPSALHGESFSECSFYNDKTTVTNKNYMNCTADFPYIFYPHLFTRILTWFNFSDIWSYPKMSGEGIYKVTPKAIP